MHQFIKSGSYVFHPFWMPIIGTALFFLVTPKIFNDQLVKALFLGLVFLTVFIPYLFLIVLKATGFIKSLRLKKVKERQLPLLFFCIMASLIINYAMEKFQIAELYFFFVGILFSGLSCLILAIFAIKASLHMVGIAGLSMFIINLSIHYHQNLILLIAFLVFASGWTAASRIQAKMHSPVELALGVFIGVFPQLTLLVQWG